MRRRMHRCDRCRNKTRTLYAWKGDEVCGICQQDNIERYEATILYRLHLSFRLTGEYIGKLFKLVIFPSQGYIRRAGRFIITGIRIIIRGTKYYVCHIWSKVRKTKR